MSRSVEDTDPFDYLVTNADKYRGGKFEIIIKDEDQLDFNFIGQDGKALDRFELYPLAAMFVDTQLKAHPMFLFVDAVLADFDNAWREEYKTRVAETN